MAGRTLKQSKGRVPTGQVQSREYLQAKKVLTEFVPAYDPELGHHLVSRPPSLLEKLIARSTGAKTPAQVKKRGRGRPRKGGAS